MATLADILSVRWAGQRWSMRNVDDYNTLVWEGPAEKPTEAQIRAHSADVDTERANAIIAQRKQDRLVADAGVLLDAFDIIVETLLDMAGKIRPTALTAPVTLSRLNTLAVRINKAKNDA